jgi:hypothetical protein
MSVITTVDELRHAVRAMVVPMVATIRAWLARAVTDATVRAKTPPFLADPDPRPAPPAIACCNSLPSDHATLWSTLKLGTLIACLVVRYRALYDQKSGEDDPFPAYVAAVHPERVRHLDNNCCLD